MTHWQAKRDERPPYYWWISENNDQRVVAMLRADEQSEIDAHLIAAAPDMLEAIEEVIDAIRDIGIDAWSDAPGLMNVCVAARDKAKAGMK